MYDEKKRELRILAIEARLEAHEELMRLIVNSLCSSEQPPAALQQALKRATEFSGPSRARAEVARVARSWLPE